MSATPNPAQPPGTPPGSGSSTPSGGSPIPTPQSPPAATVPQDQEEAKRRQAESGGLGAQGAPISRQHGEAGVVEASSAQAQKDERAKGQTQAQRPEARENPELANVETLQQTRQEVLSRVEQMNIALGQLQQLTQRDDARDRIDDIRNGVSGLVQHVGFMRSKLGSSNG